MPPRSATRKKSTWKSKQSELELSLADQINTVPESEHKGQEALSAVVKDEGGEQAAPLMIAGVEIKQELRVLDSNYADKAVMSTAVETKVKEEERNVNVNPVSFMEDGERMEGDHDKFDNAAEEKEVEGEQNEGIHVVAEQNSSEEGTAAAQIDDAEAFVDNDNFPVLNERSDGQEGGEVGGKDEEDIGDNEEDNEDEEQPAEFINNHITDRKKKKDFEIFIGRLDKGAVEDDLIEVFGKFGEIKAARIVRHPTTNKSRGFAFIQYVTVEQAKNALSALNEGIQVRGKHVVISASQDNDTLYMGNICKLWTKEHVLGTLKSYGVENIEEIYLPDDPQKEGKIKGFALLEFSTHSDAMAAFQRLRKPDAVFGRDRSAKVAFAQTPMHPNQEILSQVKTVYVEGLTDAGNKEKVKEICTQYGEVVKVQLPQSLGSKRKYFGFITFTSRESALACVEGINNAHIGQEVKVKANIAKPHFKGWLQKQGTRGGFKVKKKSEVPRYF
ncbi:polyadenylate-binding protein 1-A-like isoform X1 [Camellia sinensis]|uniref:polyadenylate-binding protein 1-A-like isoform X1 n=1 Tax=Camellia sinensis TaxID=4442 RepID=UPI00103613D1|nr:polyadenylate-binding protein 1-A-like isoform X1 [Camellia sinensis]XP_028100855.1 polyadenylate-binding protein 1-A-like isoform X1 [Camellia sinensis]